MIGSFITRAIIMALGYVYPTYECYKIVERKNVDPEHLRFWCQYWMIIALVTILERLGDILIFWAPMYNEAKLAFVIYLWYPKTLGTTYIYHSLLRPFIARHELEIDQSLDEIKTKAGDIALIWWQRGSIYVQTRFLEFLHFLGVQSNRGQKVSVSTQGISIAPPQPSTQSSLQGHPQDGLFFPPQSLHVTTSTQIHLDHYSLHCDQVDQRKCAQSSPCTLSNGEGVSNYRVERSSLEQTLPPKVLNTRILTDNPWFILARIKLLLLLCFTYKAH